jgi:hypothetical protein
MTLHRPMQASRLCGPCQNVSAARQAGTKAPKTLTMDRGCTGKSGAAGKPRPPPETRRQLPPPATDSTSSVRLARRVLLPLWMRALYAASGRPNSENESVEQHRLNVSRPRQHAGMPTESGMDGRQAVQGSRLDSKHCSTPPVVGCLSTQTDALDGRPQSPVGGGNPHPIVELNNSTTMA